PAGPAGPARSRGGGVGRRRGGARRATANQFERPAKGAGVLMALLILGEMAGFAVVVTGVVFGQLV
ncbi:hypothetical protein ACNJQJ_22855, partial [Mycobacterium tuberculosis]